jgi:NAD(P)H-flavin reductase
MQTGTGIVKEIFLDRMAAARIDCPKSFVPAPGRYVMAHASSEPDVPLAVPVFSAGTCTGGFLAASPLPASWIPGTHLNLRGPLGHGFTMPASARCVALIAFDRPSSRLFSLLEPAFAQRAAATLVCEHPPDELPSSLEIVPPQALSEVLAWADYAAVDLARDALYSLPATFPQKNIHGSAQVLVEAAMPCGGLAECGVCAVTLRHGYRLACKDGPVFDLNDLIA